MTNNNEQTINEFMGIIKNPATRIELVRRSHYYFFYTYFSNYVTYEVAPFQKKLFEITEDTTNSLAVIVSFRSSAKSTIMTMSYVLWSILGNQNKKFVLIIGQTQEQARQHFKNLRNELTENKLLRDDLGPFKEDDWNSTTLVLTRYNARITAASSEQAIRGLRHGEHRPDLIICDDVEDVNSVRTEESRIKTYNWFNSEVIPLGDLGTRVIVIGNLLHEDSLIKKLEQEIAQGKRKGIYREYPIITENKKILWPGKYKNMAAIKKEQDKIDRLTWYREYMLRIIDDREPVIDKSWIQYYDKLPEELRNESISYAAGVDIAVGEKDRHDLTGIVSCKIHGSGDKMKIYILPNPTNHRMKLPITLDNICSLVKSFGEEVGYYVYIEEVGTQKGVTQILEDKKINAIGVTVGGNDKRGRLALVSEIIRSGRVLFPKHGAKLLIDQVLNLGVVAHDDLVDALTTLLLGIRNKPPHSYNPGIIKFSFGGIFDRCSNEDWADKEDREIFKSLNSHPMGPGSTNSIEFGEDGLPRKRY